MSSMESARNGLPRTISEADRVLSIASMTKGSCHSCDAPRQKAHFNMKDQKQEIQVLVWY